MISSGVAYLWPLVGEARCGAQYLVSLVGTAGGIPFGLCTVLGGSLRHQAPHVASPLLSVQGRAPGA